MPLPVFLHRITTHDSSCFKSSYLLPWYHHCIIFKQILNILASVHWLVYKFSLCFIHFLNFFVQSESNEVPNIVFSSHIVLKIFIQINSFYYVEFTLSQTLAWSTGSLGFQVFGCCDYRDALPCMDHRFLKKFQSNSS